MTNISAEDVTLSSEKVYEYFQNSFMETFMCSELNNSTFILKYCFLFPSGNNSLLSALRLILILFICFKLQKYGLSV